MLKITEFTAPHGEKKGRFTYLKDEKYIRFEWNGGYLEMRKSAYDRLSKKKKAIIFKAAEK